MARKVKSQAQEVVVCNLCQEPVSFFCRRCGVNLCDQCALSHLRTKSKFGHDVVDFASKDDDDSFLCDSHPQHECLAYCKTCDVPICILCVSIKHKSHEISEITRQNRETLERYSSWKQSTSIVLWTIKKSPWPHDQTIVLYIFVLSR